MQAMHELDWQVTLQSLNMFPINQSLYLTAPSVRPQAVLRAAHEMEAGMGYMEPPRLYQPVKHCLGYVLMQAGNHQKAAEVSTEAYPTSA